MAQQENVQQEVKLTINDLIYAQVKDLGKRMDRLETRMDRIENRLDTTRQEFNARLDKVDARIDKLDERIDKLSEKIDGLRRDMNTSTNHGQIANISTIGIAIAVIYSLLH